MTLLGMLISAWSSMQFLQNGGQSLLGARKSYILSTTLLASCCHEHFRRFTLPIEMGKWWVSIYIEQLAACCPLQVTLAYVFSREVQWCTTQPWLACDICHFRYFVTLTMVLLKQAPSYAHKQLLPMRLLWCCMSRRLAVVTSDFHMPRSQAIFEHCFKLAGVGKAKADRSST